jgi:hypothetical protein
MKALLKAAKIRKRHAVGNRSEKSRAPKGNRSQELSVKGLRI